MSRIAEEASALFTEARRTGSLLVDLPEHLRPRSRDEVDAVQDAYARLNGVRGWKVGQVKPGESEPRCSVLIVPNLRDSPAVFQAAELAGGQAELEVGITIGRDLPRRQGAYRVEEVADAIASLHLAFEILKPAFVDASKVGGWTAVADHQGNFATVFGASCGRKSADLADLAPRLVLDGKREVTGDSTVSFEQILGSIAWLANYCAGRDLPLRAGHRIITGARVGPVDLGDARTVEGRANGFPSVGLALA